MEEHVERAVTARRARSRSASWSRPRARRRRTRRPCPPRRQRLVGLEEHPRAVGGRGREEDVEGAVPARGPGRDQRGGAPLALVEVEARVGVPATSDSSVSKNARRRPRRRSRRTRPRPRCRPVGPIETWSLAEWFAPAPAAHGGERHQCREQTPRAAVRCASPLPLPPSRTAARALPWSRRGSRANKYKQQLYVKNAGTVSKISDHAGTIPESAIPEPRF